MSSKLGILTTDPPKLHTRYIKIIKRLSKPNKLNNALNTGELKQGLVKPEPKQLFPKQPELKHPNPKHPEKHGEEVPAICGPERHPKEFE
jgi:hypothetical protein